MSDHYFTPHPQSDHQPARFSFHYRGQTLFFDTDSGVFSRLGVDKGSQCLLNALPETMAGAVLDMGCGYGAIGLSLAKVYPSCSVTLSDVNRRAVHLAAANARGNGLFVRTLMGDGFTALCGDRFHFILFNPPIRAGKQVIYRMFADAAHHLHTGGQFWLVVRKRQGAPSAVACLQAYFNQVEAADKSGGYWVLRCTIPRTEEV
ncbi:MAG: class I SAM-dependent methyltransferase [Clostridia bacterium]|nr:class I SAM-dependent methyltransferase [Clostridia bacterium]